MILNKKEIISICLISIIIGIFITGLLIFIDKRIIAEEKERLKSNIIDVIPASNKKLSFIPIDENSEEIFQEIVYDGLTIKELSDKLNKSLNSNLSGFGNVFANRCIELGIDPYLVVAITLYETGCKWNCSFLVYSCNNIGGIKGTPSCNGGSYKKFNTLEAGIDSYIDYVNNNYYKQGLTTAELMENKYTGGSTTWAIKVNNYINYVRGL